MFFINLCTWGFFCCLFTDFWTPGDEFEFIFVGPSVCLSFCNIVFLGLANCFFLISLHKVQFQKTYESYRAHFFDDNFYYAQNGVNGTILDPKLAFLVFSVNLYIRSFWNFTRW